MKTVKAIQQYLIGGFCLLLASLVSAAPAIQPPEIEAERFSRELLKTFETNQENYRKNPDAFIKEVDRLLSPVVAFDQISRYVMGKYTRRTTDDKVKQFEMVFKDSLISFYGKALLALDDTKLTIDSVDSTSSEVMKKYTSGEISRIPVKLKVKTSNRSIDVFYSMVHTDGRWKLRNISLDGINIAKQFQSQFADAVDKHRKVDYVVENWAAIMSDNAKKDDKKDAKK